MLKKIAVLGAGFGGLRTAGLVAERLQKLRLLRKYEVVVIDRNEHQTYTPLLYEVATTSKETANLCKLHEVATYPIRKIAARSPLRFIQAEISALDLIEGNIELRNGDRLSCDFLVIALGAETNYFGVKGAKENSLPLKTFSDAVAIRDKIWNLVSGGANEVRVVIGGGGATGVELAGELKEWCGELAKDIRKCRLNVSIVESRPTILPGLDGRVIARAEKRLRRLGVEILNDAKITEARENGVVLQNGKFIPFDVFVWAGGIKSSSVLAKLPLENESHGGRLVTRGEMECLPQTPELKLSMKVYGLGDSICFYDPATKKPIPAVARAALAQADIVANNIVQEICLAEFENWELKIKNYIPHEYPYVVPVGGKYAVAKIGPLVVSGFLGWIFKGLVELNYLLSIMPAWRAIKIWLKGLWIFIQNDRLG